MKIHTNTLYVQEKVNLWSVQLNYKPVVLCFQNWKSTLYLFYLYTFVTKQYSYLNSGNKYR